MRMLSLFNDAYFNYLNSLLQQLNTNNEIDNNNPYDYSLTVSKELNYEFKGGELDIAANITFGTKVKIEGAPNTFVMNFAIDIFGERGGGKYVENLFETFFEEYSRTEAIITIRDQATNEITKYYTYLVFNSPIMTTQFIETTDGYRSRYVITGNITLTSSDIITRTFSISLIGANIENSYQTINLISPVFSHNNNLQTRALSEGNYSFSQGEIESGSFSLILSDNPVSIYLYKHIVNSKNYPITSIKIKENFGTDFYELENLIINAIHSSFDETTRQTVIQVEWIKDEVVL